GADGVVEFADGRVDTELGRTIDRIVVADALATLPDRVREVVVLAYVEGLTHREIVERTRLPLGTVKSDIRRGLARIRERLEDSHA
ncbi:MAG: sigma-70 family RNA polymerase sigma factor, partial [Ilumatobacteraceae bacterium]